jgi:hypothetical protein
MQSKTIIMTLVQDNVLDITPHEVAIFLTKQNKKLFKFFITRHYLSYDMLLYGNSTLKQKIIHSFVMYYVHVDRHNAATLI